MPYGRDDLLPGRDLLGPGYSAYERPVGT